MYTSIHCHSFDPKKSALEIHSSLPRIMIISQKNSVPPIRRLIIIFYRVQIHVRQPHVITMAY